ncbi:hypothetical protein NEFER03_2100 [Nematocida sp. LUAm3]|nr:hypothetical protein NEFER03_2100 [Nematocida sp. LUAm3]KAI5175648.1 hypothetical protein NEFER02_1535 [Nematocida sp. LUAm2]KAI5178554.1 hypothetical protein NEFER01_1690 [Nematocida sp. LUAm1]
MKETIRVTERIVEILQEPEERNNSLEKECKLLPLLEELERIYISKYNKRSSSSELLSNQETSSYYENIKYCKSIVNYILTRENKKQDTSFLLYLISSPF